MTEIFKDTGPAEIVVDLPHVELVANTLCQLGGDAKASEEKRDRTLGLGVVTIEDVQVLSAKIINDGRVNLAEPNPLRNAPTSNLDMILIGLREQLRQRTGGFLPDLGKLRDVHSVHGAPHIGGSGYPDPVAAPIVDWGYEYPNARVGLIDTKLYPVDQFYGRVITVGNSLFPAGGVPFTQLDGHGAFTAGLILQQAPGAAVVTEAVLSEKEATSTVWDLAVTMARFADRDVSVLVLPLVCFTRDGERPFVLQRAVDVLRNKIVVVAAAGNHGDALPNEELGLDKDSPGFPAACDGVFGVGSLNKDKVGMAAFSPQVPWIKLVGPGEEVESTFVSGTVTYRQGRNPIAPPREFDPYTGGARWSGTSFAAATVGGEIAKYVIPGKVSAFEVVERLLEQNPNDPKSEGIGAYSLM